MEFTTESLVRAMAPVNVVIDSFQECYGPDAPTLLPDDSVPTHLAEEAQGEFAAIIYNIIQLPCDNQAAASQPTTRYIRRLLQRYASIVEQYTHLENDKFAEIMMEYQLKTIGASEIPDPRASCHVSYIVPFSEYCNPDENSQRRKKHIINIKVFPYHNDVGVRKVWEAGAALTEYLIERPELVRGKTVCELGAGVGLTGIAISGLCQTKSVHLTDYTEATLDNVEHNVKANMDWVKRARCATMGTIGNEGQPVTSGYLEWERFSEGENNIVDNTVDIASVAQTIHQTEATSMAIAKRAQVIIAADVVYDRTCIPPLVSSAQRLLSESPNKIAIFATTFRNQQTFALFETELNQAGIKCNYATTERMNYIFPCYYDQPRSDVRICEMTKV